MASANEIKLTLAALPAADRKEAVMAAAQQMSGDERRDLARQLGLPAQRATDYIWLIVVISFALVFVGAFVGLTVGMFIDKKVDLLLTVFTTTTAFLSGLLVPSPVGK